MSSSSGWQSRKVLLVYRRKGRWTRYFTTPFQFLSTLASKALPTYKKPPHHHHNPSRPSQPKSCLSSKIHAPQKWFIPANRISSIKSVIAIINSQEGTTKSLRLPHDQHEPPVRPSMFKRNAQTLFFIIIIIIIAPMPNRHQTINTISSQRVQNAPILLIAIYFKTTSKAFVVFVCFVRRVLRCGPRGRGTQSF